jgi:hypothetical protein
MKISISPTHLSSHSAGEGLRSIGKAPRTANASFVAQQRQSGADRDQAGGRKECRAVLQRRHDLHVDHAGVAVEQAPHPDLAVDIHAGGQALASVGGTLEGDGIHGPFEDEEADRYNVDRIYAHAALPMAGECCHACSIAATGAMLYDRVERLLRAMAG